MSCRLIKLFGAFAVVLWCDVGSAQIFSPGDLSKVHEDLEGLNNCLKCHKSGEEVAPQRCLECHELVDASINAGTGLHGRMPAVERRCGECHTEHLGRERKIIEWGPTGQKGFNHNRTGFPLKGEHKKIECEDCHNEKLVVDNEVKAFVRKNPSRETFMGLPVTCIGCHFDEHRGQEGNSCEDCHDEVRWKPPKRFDHDATDYPLTGAHKKVPCADCHPTLVDRKTPKDAFPKPVAMEYMKFLPLEYNRCVVCHDDPHAGKYGTRCETCHSTVDWNIMSKAAKDTGFHDKHRYPLRGQHVSVPCRSCHGPWKGKAATYKGLPFDNCTDCHFDSHIGQFEPTSKRIKAPKCEKCHTVQGFKQPKYEVPDHEETRYPLRGAHVATPCDECHTKDPALLQRIPPETIRELKRRQRPLNFSTAQFDMPGVGDKCEDCHEDVHRGVFAKQKPPKGCQKCHKQVSFHNMSLFDHDKDSRYPLVGAHITTPCNSCHLPVSNKPEDAKTRQYTKMDMRCGACHGDAHYGQFAKPKAGVQPGWEDTDCESCHTLNDWVASLFDHNDPKFSTYPLEGLHQSAACVDCHPGVPIADGVEVARYKPVPTECVACHHDYHEGAMDEVQQ